MTMLGIWKFLALALLSGWLQFACAGQLQVKSLRYWTAPDHTRMVFDVTDSPSHQVFLLKNPARLVIDIHQAKLTQRFKQPASNNPFFSRVRSAVRNKTDLRVVVDLKQPVDPKSFALKPRKQYGHRLVVDLYQKDSKSSRAAMKSKTRVTKTIKNKHRDIIIAVDAGHGGDDPGARGAHGTQEKKVVLDIAKKLAKLIDRQPGMKAVLVRKGDYYINLRKRMEIARKAKADLFVSIHADAFKNRKVRGASVFTLSRRGASSEAARWLAKHENDADLVGGVNLDEMDSTLASVLLDLSQTATKEASRKVAANVLKQLRPVGHLHKNTVQKAGFVVLKSPDIPSILVETAFISNPTEEQKLKNHRHQQKIAQAIFKGIFTYFKQYAPSDTLIASLYSEHPKHIISRGETLSGIAQKYGVSLSAIKAANSLAGNVIRVGQVLKIPAS
jgi:N-acetylmuramoyl-L-alanine amidase